MIASAIDTGLVDYILPVREIPRKLLEYIRQTPPHDGGDADLTVIEEAVLPLVEVRALCFKALGRKP